MTGETLPRYCVSNVRIAEGPVKGNVVEHHGLGCIGKRELDYSTLCEADVRAFGATGNGETARYCRTPLFKDGDHPKGVGLIENVTVSNFVFHATSDADMPLLCLETNCRNVTFDGLRRDAALDAAPKRPFARLRKMDDLRYSSDGAVSSLPCGEVRELPSSPTTLRLGL